ncbi:hypothetical protein [Planococcus maritimus]|uniref:hypothetical protein n=1 Tax=Planococcus maritimus TaxID=192421 RepID=UPI00079585E8|nr:hypothetical protein [Planococcus maritimus]KYG58477.1 hypothetical protein AY633_09410 [Planococcus maritimus]
MGKITIKDLDEEVLLQEKMETNQKEIEEARKALLDVIDKQAELLRRKIEKYVPIMKFIRAEKFYMENPNVTPKSIRGAVLDYDAFNDKTYTYDVETGWIKEIDMKTEEMKTIPYKRFVMERNLDNALVGLDYLLIIQDEIKNDIEQQKAERKQWLKEQEDSMYM